jgi:hypothetical protein
MARKIEVSRDNPLVYVKAAAGCIDADDDAIFNAFDAAETALEENAANAAELFGAFCALLDERGIVVTSRELSRQEQAEERAYEKHVAKQRGSNRGKTFGYPI